MLDLWHDAVTARPQVGEGTDLPATFGETFDAAWNEGRLFAQSVAGENARMDALQDHLDALKDKTGKDIGQSIDWSAFDVPGVGFAPPGAAALLPQVNEAAKKLGQPELSPDELEQRAVEKSRAAGTAYAAMERREQTFGSRVGSFLGGAAAQATDPVNLAALPIAPEAGSVSILAAALRFGAVAGVAQAGIEAVGAPYHEEVQPGYLASGQPFENVIEATGQGLVLGGATRFFGNAWTRFKTGAWPQSVRDAGNVVESEANISGSNIYQGAEGEAAHRQALTSAIDSVLSEKPVEVPPDLAVPADTVEATRTLAARLAEEAKTAGAPTSEVAPRLPFEASEAQAKAETAAGGLADGVSEIARRGGYAMPAEDAAAVANRLMALDPEQANAALRDLQVNPRGVAEWAKGPAGPQRTPLVSPAAQGPQVPVSPISESALEAPAHEAAVRADLDRERMTGDVKIPVDVDKDGNVIHRSVDAAMNEVDGYKTAAEQIGACAAPAAKEAA